MNSIQNQAQISYESSNELIPVPINVKTPEINTTIVDPNIHVIKSCCSKTAQRGSELRYTTTVINAGEIATTGNVLIKDYLDNAGSFVDGSAEMFRNNKQLTPAASLATLTRDTCWFEMTPGDNMPSVTITSLIPSDIIVCTYAVLIDKTTPLINNELHNSASATFNLNSHTVVQRSDICTVDVDYSELLAGKRGRSQGHDGSNLYYALQLTNEGTSAASNIIVTENFPQSFQPNTSFTELKKAIAIVNFLRHPDSIDSVNKRAKTETEYVNSLFAELNANSYRLSAIQQYQVLAAISALSALPLDEQQALIYNTTTALIPTLIASQDLATEVFKKLFTPNPDLDPQYSCTLTSIDTLYGAVEGALTNASIITASTNKDIRASYLCDAHNGGITLLDLCDEAINAITMAAVVNRFITTIAANLVTEFVILGMDTMPQYTETYAKIIVIANNAKANIVACTTQKAVIVTRSASSETLMHTTLDLVYSETDIIKEDDMSYDIEVDLNKNKLILKMKSIQIQPETTIGTTSYSGHMDIYLNGHIDITKF